MNLLDVILEEITKECEKDRNSYQNYASQEDSRKKKDTKERAKENKINNTFHIDLNDMIKRINKEDNKSTNHKTVSKMNKENKKEIVTDIRKLNKNDVIRIIDGEYKSLSDKECKFLEYCEGMDKVLIQLDELNPLYVNPEDIELVRKAKEEYKATTFNEIENKYENIIVEIENDMLTVILQDGTKSEKRLKGESRVKIMKITYYDAKIKQYLKATQKLNDIK
ncbi:hypothetical protein [Clostridium botulinum]|uniref:hypothetical protein n=1 Tax=Clostridium botulinum TaxID=1491 RepID=UPI000773A414|nr:hypothetical protein [Clostridium botulinum]APH20882.1 hypothetical protein NPD1_4152 [Clostridium botulinum]APQ71371.1 hypothetical protein RSJ8_4109 [Clostridium botulinum]MBN3367040.1 hypothetical protein [Clostridium botulinum]MBN3371676.1 hypothetical protein [Clostridium botulinum]MBN3375518.1 hypothetical protein [Clostridium botulinum]